MVEADVQAVLVVGLALERLAREDPQFGKLARLAAIPRRLDAGVVAALLGETLEPERHGVLLNRLAALDFVDTTTDGTVSYHDSVRSAVIEELRGDPGWAEEWSQAGPRL
jgi:hypothetical protein